MSRTLTDLPDLHLPIPLQSVYTHIPAIFSPHTMKPQGCSSPDHYQSSLAHQRVTIRLVSVDPITVPLVRGRSGRNLICNFPGFSCRTVERRYKVVIQPSTVVPQIEHGSKTSVTKRSTFLWYARECLGLLRCGPSSFHSRLSTSTSPPFSMSCAAIL